MLKQLLRKHPDAAEGWQLLADMATTAGRTELARLALAQYLAREPGDASCWARLADLLTTHGLLQEALRTWRMAADACTRDTSILRAWGQMALGLRALPDAENATRQLLALPDGKAAGLELQADCHKATGDPESAMAAYRAALEVDGNRASALYALAELDLAGRHEPFIEKLLERLQATSLPAREQSQVQFTLALRCERQQRFTQAMAHFHRANALAAAAQTVAAPGYQRNRIEQRTDRLQAEFPATTVQRPLPELPVGVTPIFIVGMPRSGTTLVERILAAHSSVATAGELELAQLAYLQLQRERLRADVSGPVEPGDPKQLQWLEDAREQYLEGLLERAGAAPFVIDKMPGNFLYAGLLRLLFPRAPIIHMLRDPRATCLSLYRANLGAHESYQHSLTDLRHYYLQYQKLMAHWRAVLPDPFVELRYEPLVSAPETMIPALLDAIGLPQETACLNFHAQPGTILTASHQQAREPVYTRSIEQWQQYGEALGPLLELQPETESSRELAAIHR